VACRAGCGLAHSCIDTRLTLGACHTSGRASRLPRVIHYPSTPHPLAPLPFSSCSHPPLVSSLLSTFLPSMLFFPHAPLSSSPLPRILSCVSPCSTLLNLASPVSSYPLSLAPPPPPSRFLAPPLPTSSSCLSFPTLTQNWTSVLVQVERARNPSAPAGPASPVNSRVIAGAASWLAHQPDQTGDGRGPPWRRATRDRSSGGYAVPSVSTEQDHQHLRLLEWRP